MESYASLLQKTRVPQSSLQKIAVISIFSKLRSAPSYLDPDSEPGREAIYQCLHSASPAVVEQSVSELCRLVSDSKLDLSRGLLEFHSALEGSEPKFVGLFVKALGFLARVGFVRNHGSQWFSSPENHPFVKILSCRTEVQTELVQQVLVFMAQNRRLGMVEVCEFLRPFLNFSILRMSFSDSSSSLFLRQLISSMASFCCSFPDEAIPVLKLLAGSLKYIPRKNTNELRNSYYFMECMVDSYTVVLRHLVGRGLLVTEAQLCGVQMSETILSLLTCDDSGGGEPTVDLVKWLFVVQKDLGLQYIPELSSALLSLWVVLIKSELEHEQLSSLKFLIFLVKWKSENEHEDGRIECALSEELLLIIPVISLMSSVSRSVKAAATDLLVMLESLLLRLLGAPKIEPTPNRRSPSVSSLGSIIYRLLQHLWLQDQFSLSNSFFVNFASGGKTDVEGMHSEPKPWVSLIREHSLWIIDRQKSSLPILQSQQSFLTEMPLFISAITGVLVMHQSLGNIAIDLLAAVGVMDPKQGVPLLLDILFYSKIFTRKDINCRKMLPKLLAVLPSLASHVAMIPLIVQTILPMLQKDGKQELYAIGARLLCQTWAINDRAFGSLQGVLRPTGFNEFKFEKTICISLAASIRDVCRKSPDRGVDLILSISACVESQEPTIQALGLQSLAHLCEADVIDFYTAWEVISKHVLDYSSDPVLARRWGAMDAETYSEASRNVLQILWHIGTFTHITCTAQWAKARSYAFEALTQYEVSHIEKVMPDFKKENTDLLLTETNLDVLRAMEGFQVKIITHEHLNRRRLIKEKKVARSKIEKLLDVFPQLLFPTGRKSNAGQLPGAALLCLSLTLKDVNNQELSRFSPHVHAGYENAVVEIASSLQLSRNVFVGILSLQSWKSFLRRWMRANILSLDAKAPSTALEKTFKAANDILKSLTRLAEDSIPRSAENIALAVGALCAILPPSAHSIKSSASKFLLNWLFQYEHEHRQWSAAISLGLISSCLHVTDHEQKFQNITGLIEVLSGSKSTLVKGACSVGLGYSCHDLLTRVEPVDSIDMEKESCRRREVDLLGKIVSTLFLMTSKLNPTSSDILDGLSAYFPLGTKNMDAINSELILERCEDLQEDIWGVAGLAIGLASSISAIYRAGAYDAVLKIKDLVISWIPHVDSLVSNLGFSSEGSEKVLSVGSCLALPTVVAFCRRVEMMNDNELDHLLNGYSELISELLAFGKSGTFHQGLLMASCVGAGTLLAFILNEGMHTVEVECVKNLLELFRKCYASPFPPVIHLGGMLGVVNAMGAGAGNLFHGQCFLSSMKTGYEQQESSYILGPLLSSPMFEQHLTTLMQEIFLVAQNSDDLQMQQNAAWAVSFLRNHLWSKGLLNVESSAQTDVVDSKTLAHSFSADSSVMKLSIWLMHLNYSGAGMVTPVGTVVTVLRCLARAPRLPSLDWGVIIRRCMRYEAHVSESLPPDSALKRGILREECVKFSLAHASQFDPLLTFLDELSDISRFRALEANMQSCLLFHLDGLIKVFSGSRIQKLLDDTAEFFFSDSLHQTYSPDQKSMLRKSCWKGLYQSLEQASLGSLDYISNVEKCMEVLFSLLPASVSATMPGLDVLNYGQEWSEAVKCLAKARGHWLLDFLQVPLLDSAQGDVQFNEVVKKILAKAKLVRMCSIPFTELARLKAYVLNSRSQGIWNVLVEVVAALQYADGSVKQQWLVDAVEISCVSNYPSTALQFLGLLSDCWCKYMPLLILDPLTVLSDLPVTLPSLLRAPSWEVVAESIVPKLFASTERLYHWVNHDYRFDDTPSAEPIDESENDITPFLLLVMHHTCVSLNEYLPMGKQLRLANMMVSCGL